MTRRLITNIALGVAGAFALAVAVPAYACDCDKKQAADKAEKKAGDKPKASADTTTGTLLAAACNCGAKDAKDCKCGKDCKCTEKKPEAPKAKAA
jgi:hypothetical protein